MDGDRHVRLSELLIGTEGLALLRNLYDGSDEEAATRLREVRSILNRGGGDEGHAGELHALRGAGLRLEQLIEPRLNVAHTSAKRRASAEIPDATIQAYAGLPGVLVLEAVKP